MNNLVSSPTILVLFYCMLVLMASLGGGALPSVIRLTHTRLQLAISFVAGVILGLSVLHLLPHACEELHSTQRGVSWLMGGFLVMFFLQRFLPFHHHDVHEGQPVAACGHSHPMAEHATGHLNWISVALGLSLHSVFDGLAITAAVVSGEHGHGGMLGLGTALAVILHKPFGAMAITTLMAASAEPPKRRRAINFAFALVTPLGAMLFYLGASQIAHTHGDMLGCALAFCAGTFLCIACSDLLPELHFHAHDRLALSLALLAGLSVAVLIGYFGHAGHAEHRHVHAPLLPRPAVSGSSAIDFPRPESWIICDQVYCACQR